jgi:hypothetical protein
MTLTSWRRCRASRASQHAQRQLIDRTTQPESRVNVCMKRSISTGTSSRRSRSGGTGDDDVEPVEQVRGTPHDHLVKVAVGRGDDATRLMAAAVGADLLQLARFEESQQESLRSVISPILPRNTAVVGDLSLPGLSR